MTIPAEELDRRFDFHAPNDDRKVRHEAVRKHIKTTAQLITALIPAGRECSLALTHLEEAMFWANAAITRESDQTVKSVQVTETVKVEEKKEVQIGGTLP